MRSASWLVIAALYAAFFAAVWLVLTHLDFFMTVYR